MRRYWPRGAGAPRVIKIIERAAEGLADHPVNRARLAAGHLPATHIGSGARAARRAGIVFSALQPHGAVITAVDIIRGLAISTEMALLEVPGATGYIDTDYDAKGTFAIRALEQFDIVFVHIEAADEAGHQGDALAKKLALERIDEGIVGPVSARCDVTRPGACSSLSITDARRQQVCIRPCRRCLPMPAATSRPSSDDPSARRTPRPVGSSTPDIR